MSRSMYTQHRRLNKQSTGTGRSTQPEVPPAEPGDPVLLTLVFIAGIIFFVLWLSLRPHRPKFTLADFAIPNINRQSGAVNLPVKFTVNEHNPNQKIGIYFDAVYGSVYYDNNKLIASGPVAYPFYQPPKGDMLVQGELTASGPTPTDPSWQRFASEVGGSVEMRLVLNSTVRFMVKLWDTREHHMKVDCGFKLSGDGTVLQKNSPCDVYF